MKSSFSVVSLAAVITQHESVAMLAQDMASLSDRSMLPDSENILLSLRMQEGNSFETFTSKAYDLF